MIALSDWPVVFRQAEINAKFVSFESLKNSYPRVLGYKIKEGEIITFPSIDKMRFMEIDTFKGSQRGLLILVERDGRKSWLDSFELTRIAYSQMSNSYGNTEVCGEPIDAFRIKMLSLGSTKNRLTYLAGKCIEGSGSFQGVTPVYDKNHSQTGEYVNMEYVKISLIDDNDKTFDEIVNISHEVFAKTMTLAKFLKDYQQAVSYCYAMRGVSFPLYVCSSFYYDDEPEYDEELIYTRVSDYCRILEMSEVNTISGKVIMLLFHKEIRHIQPLTARRLQIDEIPRKIDALSMRSVHNDGAGIDADSKIFVTNEIGQIFPITSIGANLLEELIVLNID